MLKSFLRRLSVGCMIFTFMHKGRKKKRKKIFKILRSVRFPVSKEKKALLRL